jgi:hypothetical protein
MSEIELGPLSERLDDDEVKTLRRLVSEVGGGSYRNDDGPTQLIANRLNEEAMTEFLDRLDAHDIAAEIYLPLEFDGRLTVGDYRVASTQTLMDTLGEIKDELDIEDEENEDEDEDKDDTDQATRVIEVQLRHIWRLLSDACHESLDKKSPIHLRV